jgi:hypothetical protein
MTAAAPSGVVTFLFTDVEGSTRRWEADADLMRAALAAHDDVLRSAIEGHGGFMFKHTGDGVCAAFSSPRAAVDAAIAAQRALELPVRMGIPNGHLHPLADGEGDIERPRSGSVSDSWYAPILNKRRLSVTPQIAEQRAGVPGDTCPPYCPAFAKYDLVISRLPGQTSGPN